MGSNIAGPFDEGSDNFDKILTASTISGAGGFFLRECDEAVYNEVNNSDNNIATMYSGTTSLLWGHHWDMSKCPDYRGVLILEVVL